MRGLDDLLACLPAPPDFNYDWRRIGESPLAPLLRDMARTRQNPAWHGEGDVAAHTRMVCETLTDMAAFRALPERQRQTLALAALLHDVGKITRTRLEDSVLVSPGHGPAGATVVRRLLWQTFGLAGTDAARAFRETVCLLIRYHTLPLHLLDQEDPSRRARKSAANGELLPDWTLHALFLLSEADVRGRISPDKEEKLDVLALNRLAAEEAGCLTGPYAFPSAHTERAYLAGRGVWPGEPLYDDTWGAVLLMCGLPGTGKDTWLRTNHPDLPTVCLDDIRRELNVAPSHPQGRVVQTATERARAFLRVRQPFAWNATCLTFQNRARLVDLFEQYHASVHIVCLETPWGENLHRNAGRSDAVPEHVIDRMLGDFVLPERFEATRVTWISC